MKPSTLLKKAGVSPDEPAFSITAQEAAENLLDAIEEYCPDLEISKMTKEDIRTLINSYGSCVVNYHPEDYHQERAVLLENFDMLRRYGLTDDDYHAIDFY